MPAFDVGELVGEDADRLGVVSGAGDANGSCGRVGVAVGGAAVTTLHGVAVGADLRGKGVPEPGGHFSGGGGVAEGGQVVAVGLLLGEHVGGAEAAQLSACRGGGVLTGGRRGAGRRWGLGVVGGLGFGPEGAGGEDRNALLSLANLTAEGLPGAEPGDAGRGGGL